jgi:hypothetical protein
MIIDNKIINSSGVKSFQNNIKVNLVIGSFFFYVKDSSGNPFMKPCE